MDRALPDDVPIEAHMVTKAIERAQHTVERRNAEIRKDVLKYDEVMNEQRKVIYERRLQIIDGEDLTSHTDRAARRDDRRACRRQHCPNEFPEDWDLEGLVAEVDAVLPDAVHRRGPGRRDEHRAAHREHPRRGARVLRRARDETFPGGDETAREIERQVMLQIIDQRWREHLVEMDYLREGIHLRGHRADRTRSSRGSARASRCSAS